MVKSKLIIRSQVPLYEYDSGLVENEEISFARQKGFIEGGAEFLAIVTFSGLALRAVRDVVLAMIKRNEPIEIKFKDTSIKGLSYEKARELLAILDSVELDEQQLIEQLEGGRTNEPDD